MEMTIYDVIIRLAAAIFVGGLIGYEREIRNKPAGFLTFMLVSVGSALIAIMQIRILQETIELFNANPEYKDIINLDTGRVVAQVVSGIGFLGAGAIIHRSGFVQGITTAALLWVSAGMGLVIGLGYYDIAAVATAIIIPTLYFARGINKRIGRYRKINKLRIVYHENIEDEIFSTLKKNKVVLKNTYLHNTFYKDNIQTKETFIYFILPRNIDLVNVINIIHDLEGVIEVETV